MANPYMTLGIPENASAEIIRQAYLNKVRTFPPEKEPQRFQSIAEAYEKLKDETTRARLRVFGAANLTLMRRLTDLVPAADNARQRIGMDTWLEANGESS